MGVARRCSRAAASIQRAGAPPAAMLGMGAVLLDSTEMLVVGDLLVLVHEEGTLMSQGGEENFVLSSSTPKTRFSRLSYVTSALTVAIVACNSFRLMCQTNSWIAVKNARKVCTFSLRFRDAVYYIKIK